jgi:hypothetical protein
VFLLKSVQSGSGAHLVMCSLGSRGPFVGVKQQLHEAGHSPLYSAEVKNK